MMQNKALKKFSIGAGLAVGGASLVAAGVAAAIRYKRRFSFDGKVVFITGGSRGLGLILARQFAAAGAKLAICARTAEQLADARAELAAKSVHLVLAIRCDVTDPEQITGAVDEVAGRYGRLDVLVNNAGLIQVGPVGTMSADDFEAAMKTNFWAAYHATMTAIPHLKAGGGGRIVNIASIGGKVSVPHLLPYSASKFALVGLSEGLRHELLAENIYVTTVCPGLITTGSPRNADFKGKAEQEYAWFAAGDAAPGVAMDADRMASKILRAVRNGDAELIRPVSASVQSKIQGVMPGVTSEILSLLSRLLPADNGNTRSQKGADVDSLEPASTAAINRSAARKNNEL